MWYSLQFILVRFCFCFFSDTFSFRLSSVWVSFLVCFLFRFSYILRCFSVSCSDSVPLSSISSPFSSVPFPSGFSFSSVCLLVQLIFEFCSFPISVGFHSVCFRFGFRFLFTFRFLSYSFWFPFFFVCGIFSGSILFVSVCIPSQFRFWWFSNSVPRVWIPSLFRFNSASVSDPFYFVSVPFLFSFVSEPFRARSVPFPFRCVPCPFRFRSAIFCFRSLSFCFYFPFLSFPIVFHFLFRLNVDWRSFGFSFAVPFLFPFCSPLVFLLLFASVLFFRFYSVTAFFSIGFGFGSDRFYSASQFHSISVSDYFYFLSVRFLFRFVSVPSRVLSVPFPFNFYSVSLFHFYSVRLGFVTLGWVGSGLVSSYG